MTKQQRPRHPWKSAYEDWRDPRPCHQCGQLFFPLHHRASPQRFCNKHCATAWRIAHAGPVPMRGFVPAK